MFVCVRCTACSYCNLELVFLLDASTKFISNAWRQILEYTSSVIGGYNINPNCVRVAVISYSDNAVVSIQWNRYNDRNSLQQAVRQLRQLGGRSNVASAFTLLRTTLLPGIRANTGLIAVVVTDQIQSSQQITTEANNLKSQGVTIIAVGITAQDRVDGNALTAIATNNYVVSVGDYSQLASVVSRVTQQWGCFVVSPPTPAPPAADRM